MRASGQEKKTAGKKKSIPVPNEHQEQMAFFQMAAVYFKNMPELKYLLFAIPNGGLRNKIVALKMQAEGQKKGIPDIFCAIPKKGWHGLFIEMKKKEGGTLSKEQKEAIAFLREQGYRVEVAKGADNAFNILCRYLENQ